MAKVNPFFFFFSVETCNKSPKATANQVTYRKRGRKASDFQKMVLTESLAVFLLPCIFLSSLCESWNKCSDWPQSLYEKIFQNPTLLPSIWVKGGGKGWNPRGRILIITITTADTGCWSWQGAFSPVLAPAALTVILWGVCGGCYC